MGRQRLRIQVGWTRVAVIMTANTAAIIVIAGLHPSGPIRSLAARHRASLFALVPRHVLPVQPRSGLVIGAMATTSLAKAMAWAANNAAWTAPYRNRCAAR